MNWEEMTEKRAPKPPKTVYACDCHNTIIEVVPTKEGLCPHCGYYARLEPEWNVKASVNKRIKEAKLRQSNLRETRGRKYKVIVAKKAIMLRKSGLTLTKIAKELGISLASAHKYTTSFSVEDHT